VPTFKKTRAAIQRVSRGSEEEKLEPRMNTDKHDKKNNSRWLVLSVLVRVRREILGEPDAGKPHVGFD
jgi:hypothetical protein